MRHLPGLNNFVERLCPLTPSEGGTPALLQPLFIAITTTVNGEVASLTYRRYGTAISKPRMLKRACRAKDLAALRIGAKQSSIINYEELSRRHLMTWMTVLTEVRRSPMNGLIVSNEHERMSTRTVR